MYGWIDFNLELYHSYNPNAVTLLDVIDKTLSPMGGLLKRWLASFKDSNKIQSRHEVVSIYKKTRKYCKNAKSNKTNFRFRAANF
jgi:DNA mismatch repair protein MutS